MEIASVEVLQVGSELSGAHTVARLATDTGIVGVGQSGAWGYPNAVAEIVRALEPVLLGADPFRTEYLWNAMARVRPFRGNLISSAISAVDNALWDIKGKALQVPVWELLGGRSRDKVRLHALIGGANPGELAKSVRWALDEGYTAIKFDPLVAGYQDMSMAKLVASACEMAAAAARVRRRGPRHHFRVAPEARPGQRFRRRQRAGELPAALYRGPHPDRLHCVPGRSLQTDKCADGCR